jgi:hypothetical protein
VPETPPLAADLGPEAIDKKIIKLAILGERDPDLTCERALIDLPAQPPQEPPLGV